MVLHLLGVVPKELDGLGDVAQCFEPVLADLDGDDRRQVELLCLHHFGGPCA